MLRFPAEEEDPDHESKLILNTVEYWTREVIAVLNDSDLQPRDTKSPLGMFLR